MLEIEIKSPCRNKKQLIERLLSLGAKHIKTIAETDLYYNHPSRDFKNTDEALRIRTANGKNIVTYKGPKLGGLTKTRLERESAIEDPVSFREILSSLGFIPSGTVQKERETYSLADIKICIDSINGLGCFVELEKISDDRKTAESDLFKLAKDLSLDEFITESYLEMVLSENHVHKK